MKRNPLSLKSMGVINITPDSFSDGGEVQSQSDITLKIAAMGPMDALDIGAESTAPGNLSLSASEEWSRWEMILPLLSTFSFSISADTYHPETIFNLVKFWRDNKFKRPLFWNDVSGKFDESVQDFLREGEPFHYIFCHNRAPSRELSGKHMNYVLEGDILKELTDFFRPHVHPRVLFDPCFGFSKSYEENWMIFNQFPELQDKVGHNRWVLGLSRKSFLRKKLGLAKVDKKVLDLYHLELLNQIIFKAQGEVWIRTHRPELLVSNLSL